MLDEQLQQLKMAASEGWEQVEPKKPKPKRPVEKIGTHSRYTHVAHAFMCCVHTDQHADMYIGSSCM